MGDVPLFPEWEADEDHRRDDRRLAFSLTLSGFLGKRVSEDYGWDVAGEAVHLTFCRRVGEPPLEDG